MTSNSGVYPLDPTTPVGLWRLSYGDTQSVPFDPVTPGFQNYTAYSDAEISQFLSAGSNSIDRAIAYAYLQQSGAAARQSKSVKDYDLAADLTKRAGDLRTTAQFYFSRASQDGQDEYFSVVDTGNNRSWLLIEEANDFPYIDPRLDDWWP